MIKVIVHGLGRLGRSVCAAGGEKFIITAAIDNAPTNAADFAFPIFTTPSACDIAADVIIDCSIAPAVEGIVTYAVCKKTPLIICTTGLDDEILGKIKAAAKDIPIFLSANMSLGVNLAVKFVRDAAKILGADFDIEIIEKHHNQKIDAPSGTAVLLANNITDVMGARKQVHGRSGFAKRENGEIGIHSIRGGTIVGEHSVIFAGPDEIIEIKHAALSRDAFARGAIVAAEFITGQKPGLYTMNELLK